MSRWISRIEAVELGITRDELTKFSKSGEIKTDRTHKRKFHYWRDDVIAVATKLAAGRVRRKSQAVNPDSLEKAFNEYVRSRGSK